MQKLPMKFVMLLMIFLSGCQTPKPLIVPQRFVYLHFVEVDGQQVVDPGLSFCQERKYKFSIHFLGPTEKFNDVPLSECTKITGYGPRAYADQFNYLEDARIEAEANHEH